MNKDVLSPFLSLKDHVWLGCLRFYVAQVSYIWYKTETSVEIEHNLKTL